MEPFSWLLALAIFSVYIVLDALYAVYTIQVTKGHALTAATVSFFMHFIIAFGVLNYVQNWKYVFPVAIGSWIGTFISVKLHNIKNRRENGSQKT